MPNRQPLPSPLKRGLKFSQCFETGNRELPGYVAEASKSSDQTLTITEKDAKAQALNAFYQPGKTYKFYILYSKDGSAPYEQVQASGSVTVSTAVTDTDEEGPGALDEET
ncbi:MAG TPA: hypothetical protein DDW49_05645 [Deltaproteobacteria bacterium]|nr:MAG: hypothetical protein A2048_05025 [Deltaproteobacteria bacterium GWA2_45_12]HBF12857.1 hypothetical protein [Deltaproteobacteria bacterium]